MNRVLLHQFCPFGTGCFKVSPEKVTCNEHIDLFKGLGDHTHSDSLELLRWACLVRGRLSSLHHHACPLCLIAYDRRKLEKSSLKFSRLINNTGHNCVADIPMYVYIVYIRTLYQISMLYIRKFQGSNEWVLHIDKISLEFVNES